MPGVSNCFSCGVDFMAYSPSLTTLSSACASVSHLQEIDVCEMLRTGCNFHLKNSPWALIICSSVSAARCAQPKNVTHFLSWILQGQFAFALFSTLVPNFPALNTSPVVMQQTRCPRFFVYKMAIPSHLDIPCRIFEEAVWRSRCALFCFVSAVALDVVLLEHNSSLVLLEMGRKICVLWLTQVQKKCKLYTSVQTSPQPTQCLWSARWLQSVHLHLGDCSTFRRRVCTRCRSVMRLAR